jgi:hypothetical protein
MKLRRSGLVSLALLLGAGTWSCTTEYGRPRAPFARPVLLTLPAPCSPIQSGPSTLSVGVAFEQQPLSGVLLRLTSLSGSHASIPGITDRFGQYKVVLQPGLWELECQLAGFAPLRTRVNIPELGECRVSVLLELSVQITVT